MSKLSAIQSEPRVLTPAERVTTYAAISAYGRLLADLRAAFDSYHRACSTVAGPDDVMTDCWWKPGSWGMNTSRVTDEEDFTIAGHNLHVRWYPMPENRQGAEVTGFRWLATPGYYSGRNRDAVFQSIIGAVREFKALVGEP